MEVTAYFHQLYPAMTHPGGKPKILVSNSVELDFALAVLCMYLAMTCPV